jgi:hypothetical protein
MRASSISVDDRPAFKDAGTATAAGIGDFFPEHKDVQPLGQPTWRSGCQQSWTWT